MSDFGFFLLGVAAGVIFVTATGKPAWGKLRVPGPQLGH